MNRCLPCLGSLVLAAACLPSAALAQGAGERRQGFDADPGWESYRNRLIPNPPRITRQDFGYRTTAHARGTRPGEIGGWIQRSITPAFYAKSIPEKTLNDRLTA